MSYTTTATQIAQVTEMGKEEGGGGEKQKPGTIRWVFPAGEHVLRKLGRVLSDACIDPTRLS